MTKLSLAHYFKKKDILIDGEYQEVFMLKDLVTGIIYISDSGISSFNIINGEYPNTYAFLYNHEKNDGENVAYLLNLNNLVNENKNFVNYEQLRKNESHLFGSFFVRDETNPYRLKIVSDPELQYLAEKQFYGNDYEIFFDETKDIKTMYENIKKIIISQDDQVKAILTTIYKNQKLIDSDLSLDLIAKLKENLLIYGPTGTGKTEILKCISRIYNVPIVIEDATSLSETGYHGRDVSAMLVDLVEEAGGSVECAETGILVIDEFDKLAEVSGGSENHVSRLGVQRGLLKLLDGSEFYLGNNITFNTSMLTVVCLGAFTNLYKSKESKPVVGFGSNDKPKEPVTIEVNSQDFIKYGIMKELLGRFSKFVRMNSLNKEDILKILKTSDYSPINTYKKMFDVMGVEISCSDEFIEWLSDEAVKLDSGARSLKTMFDECISDALFNILSGESNNVALVKPATPEEKPYLLSMKA